MEIQGERILLRSTAQNDLEDLMGLWNDGRVMRWVGFPEGLGYDRDAVQAWFDKLQANPLRHHFVILNDEIGFCGEVYYAVDVNYQRASLDIKLLPKSHGLGLATDALRTLIEHVFKVEQDVNSVWTQPSLTNDAAHALYRRCGMKPKTPPLDLKQSESLWELTRADSCRDEAGKHH